MSSSGVGVSSDPEFWSSVFWVPWDCEESPAAPPSFSGEDSEPVPSSGVNMRGTLSNFRVFPQQLQGPLPPKCLIFFRSVGLLRPIQGLAELPEPLTTPPATTTTDAQKQPAHCAPGCFRDLWGERHGFRRYAASRARSKRAVPSCLLTAVSLQTRSATYFPWV